MEEVPQDVIKKWQDTWKCLLDMAYHRKNVTHQFWIDNTHYDDLYHWSKNASNFEEIQFITTWRKYDVKDSSGGYVDPLCSPELKHMYVPRLLFYCVGVGMFLDECFPECELTYWEDDGPV